MTMQKVQQGKRGEEFAASYLRKLGFRIIGRNFRIRGGELDIIAIEPPKRVSSTNAFPKPETLVFVEVKTRSSNDFGTPLESIGYYKLRSLIRTAEFYRMKHSNLRLPELMRIDAVSVTIGMNNELLDIELVKNIS